ncbi:dynein axonemal intermediate chain 3 isoform X1 [Xyrichtys novacula]|uniref:Dynein axonemal intermediate chain 3 isoform X1 n=1 Tax=Xyrichtys novacula TaxID=13765 RepID=A0AAV1FJ77_XYRNO|nr:dynein axonemal intermediate chain 3 isoform X1 [Xyrichtys novacula]
MPPKRPKSGKGSSGSKRKSKDDDDPDDIFPMVLTSATQQLFGCRADEDVTGESPYKLLRKDDIVQDMKKRAAVSDFSPVKQTVLDYPEDEILLVFDRDFLYGQSFYLVLTPEAKERILHPPKPETAEAEVIENDAIKTPEPRQWISQGSEQEIENECVKETREKLCIKFSRVRRKFGAPVCFSDHNADFIECPSYKDSRFSIKQMQRDCGLQAVPTLQSSSAQTQRKVLRNIHTQYTPRELSDEDKENIHQSESLRNFLKTVTPRVLHALQQAEIMDEFTDDRKALSSAAKDDDSNEQVYEDLMLVRVLANRAYTKDKTIRCINWHPTIQGVIAVALTERRETQLNESTDLTVKQHFILFYSCKNSTTLLLLEGPDGIFAFDFSPSDPNIIVGGCANGQVVLWDISAYVTYLQGTQPGGKKSSVNTDTFASDDKDKKTPVVRFCAASSGESVQEAPITDVQWLPPTFEVTKTGEAVENKNKISVQFVTCSPCAIMFWDVRVSKQWSSWASGKKHTTAHSVSETFKHLGRWWKPLFKITPPMINTRRDYSPLKFSLEHYTCTDDNTAGTTDDPADGESSEVVPDYSQLRTRSAQTLKPLEDVNTRMYVGTQEGVVVYTDWKQDNKESGHLHNAKSLHHGVVNTVQRSPFYKDTILTIEDWNFAIWKEGVTDGPIFTSPTSETAYTAGCCSPSRSTDFFIGNEDGSIEVWDLLKKTKEPVQVYKHVIKARITCIKSWSATTSKHYYLAVSDDVAAVFVFRLPKSLYKKESLGLEKFFELEEDRLKDFQRRVAKMKKEADELRKKGETNKQIKTPEEQKEEEIEMKEYKEYLTLEENILKGLGLWQAPAEA